MPLPNGWDELFERIHMHLLGRFAGVRGDEYIYFCIFHQDENTPNMYINKTKGVFHCWACGAKGSLLSLAERLGIGIRMHGMKVQGDDDTLAHFLYSASFPLTQEEMETLCTSRKISRDILLKAEPRFLHNLPPGNPYQDTNINAFVGRYVFPIRNPQNELEGVVGYNPKSAQKYIYPTQSSLYPYGMNFIPIVTPRQKEKPLRIFVVEGLFDALTALEWGDYGIALLGVGNSRLLRYLSFYNLSIYNIYLSPDFDKAGRHHLYAWARDAIAAKIFPSWVIYTTTSIPTKDFNDLHAKANTTIDALIEKGLVNVEATTVFLLEETERRGEPLPPVIIFLMFSLGVLDALETLLLVKKDLVGLAGKVAERAALRRQSKVLGVPSLLTFLETSGMEMLTLITAATTMAGKKIILEYFYYHEVEGLFNILPHMDGEFLPLGLKPEDVRNAVRRIATIYRRLQPNAFFNLSDYIVQAIIPLLPD